MSNTSVLGWHSGPSLTPGKIKSGESKLGGLPTWQWSWERCSDALGEVAVHLVALLPAVGNLEPGAGHQLHAVLVHKCCVLVQNSPWWKDRGGATFLPFLHPAEYVLVSLHGSCYLYLPHFTLLLEHQCQVRVLIPIRLGHPGLDELKHLVAVLDVVARDVGHHPVDVVVPLPNQRLQRLVRQDNCVEGAGLGGP